MNWGYVLAPFLAFIIVFGSIILVLKYGADFLDWLHKNDE